MNSYCHCQDWIPNRIVKMQIYITFSKHFQTDFPPLRLPTSDFNADINCWFTVLEKEDILKRHVAILMKLGNDENGLEEIKGYTFR